MPKRKFGPLTGIGLLVAAFVLTLGTSAPAFCGWECGGGGPRGWRASLTPEQAAQVFDLHHKFFNDTAELRKTLLVRRAELEQLWRAEKPDEKAILAKVKELESLRAQMREKAVSYHLALKKILPQAPGPFFRRGPGFGPPMGPCGGLAPGKASLPLEHGLLADLEAALE